MSEWIVAAPSHPLARMTAAAFPLKAAKTVSPSMLFARCRASVVLPVPAYPNSRKTCGEPDLSQRPTLSSAAACSVDQTRERAWGIVSA